MATHHCADLLSYYVATVIKTVGTGGEMSYKSTEQNKNSQVDLEI